jgi:hypothetical protein
MSYRETTHSIGRKHYVYLIECDHAGIYKIGYSEKPTERLAALQTSSPCPLRLVLTIKEGNPRLLEKDLHMIFWEQRQYNEWFKLSPEDVQWIQSLAELSGKQLEGEVYKRLAGVADNFIVNTGVVLSVNTPATPPD